MRFHVQAQVQDLWARIAFHTNTDLQAALTAILRS